jgi:hypothetical protein
LIDWLFLKHNVKDKLTPASFANTAEH